MTTLVTGATGTIGREIVRQLVDVDQPVRALTRNPSKAGLPGAVEIVAGDLTDPTTLETAFHGVTTLHLISLGGDDYAPLKTAREVIDRATSAGVRRVTVLTGTADEVAVARAVEDSGVEWTHVRPVEFMSNTLQWAGSIRAERVVRAPFGLQPHAIVHEADVAAVVVAALLEDGHAGQTYTPTGPEALTPIDVVATISGAIGADIEFVELSVEQARDQMVEAGLLDDVIDYVVAYGVNPPESASTVLATVEEVTGRPSRTFAQWAAEHADAFRT